MLCVGDYMGFAPTGQAIDFETCEVYEIDAGRVIATWVYGDLDQLVRQISLREREATTEGWVCPGFP